MCALGAAALFAIQPLFLFLVASSLDGLTPMLGEFHWQAIAYAFWDQMACVMIVPAMLWAFSTGLNRQGPVTPIPCTLPTRSSSSSSPLPWWASLFPSSQNLR